MPPGDYQLRAHLKDGEVASPTHVFDVRHTETATESVWVQKSITISAGSTVSFQDIIFSDSAAADLDATSVPGFESRLDDMANIFHRVRQFVDFTTEMGAGWNSTAYPTPVEVYAFSTGVGVIDPKDACDADCARYVPWDTFFEMGTGYSLYPERNAEHDNAPENGEWHELGHHLFSLNIGDGLNGDGSQASHYLCHPNNTPPCSNHDGYKNPVTQDSMDEAFAAFIGAVAWTFIEEDASFTGDKAGLDPGGVDDAYADFGSVESNGWKPWYDPDWTSDDQHIGEESAFTALLWDLWDANPDVHITEVKANVAGDHELVFLVDEISLTLQQIWAALDAVDPILDPTIAGFREALIAQLPAEMSALTIDLDGDTVMDVAPIDIVSLSRGNVRVKCSAKMSVRL